MVCKLPRKIVVADVGVPVTVSSSGTNGAADQCYIEYKGTQYYSKGDTITVKTGDTLTCHAEVMSSSTGSTRASVYVNGTLVSGGSYASTTYYYVIPNGITSISVEFYCYTYAQKPDSNRSIYITTT